MKLPLATTVKLAAIAALLLFRVGGAAVLPDDRADIFYSDYKGGGMDITGKSVLVRKKFTEQFAVEGNYFVDTVSGASIDVNLVSNASVVKDERKQKSLSLEYIHDKTIYNVSYANSTERDYVSNTTHFSLSQDMFGDLTTVTFGFTDSRNEIGKNINTSSAPDVRWRGHSQSRSYEVGLSQILTKNLIGGATLEVVTDQGLLSNPYRQIRYASNSPRGYSLSDQIFPNTHTSSALEGRAKYYLPYRAAASLSYRYFSDTWGIKASTAQLEYTHPISNLWILEGRFRYYSQTHANFYRDLFEGPGVQNFEGRDRNLAASDNYLVGLKATYAFLPDGWKFFKRGTVTGDVSRIKWNYKDFRNTYDTSFAAGTEPLYEYSATVYQIYASMFF